MRRKQEKLERWDVKKSAGSLNGKECYAKKTVRETTRCAARGVRDFSGGMKNEKIKGES